MSLPQTRKMEDYITNGVTHISLMRVLTELQSTIDEIGFVKGQITIKKRDHWAGMPEQSVQLKDRIAAYAVAEEHSELERLIASKECLEIERSFVERLLDAAV